MAKLTKEQYRSVSLIDLDLDGLVKKKKGGSGNPVDLGKDKSQLSDDDEYLLKLKAALSLGFSGVILVGPPGTGKSWYAQQLAVALTSDWNLIRSVQFHPSYQYEDFIFGYVPSLGGGFELSAKEFPAACHAAAAQPERKFVLIIDEISRSDVVRVFGEALTYIEPDKRDQPFILASGRELTVPKNLIIIGTMNPWDKGVDEIDAALERRFAYIEIPPSSEVLRKIIIDRGAKEDFAQKIIVFFEQLQSLDLETVRIGHAYFLSCIDDDSAMNIWEFRLKPTFQRACRFDSDTYAAIENSWNGLFLDSLVESEES